MANSADPDQLASSLFAKAGYIRVQQDKGNQVVVAAKWDLPFEYCDKLVV